MSKRSILSLWVVLGIFLALSCSGGAGNPTAPQDQLNSSQGLTATAAQSEQNLPYPWGFYAVYLDIENKQVEVVPARSLEFTANVMKFLNNDPFGLQVAFNGTTPGTGYIDIDMDITIKHPLSDHAYDGYDVRGIFMGNGSGTMAYNSDLKYPVAGTNQILLNADGYTRWFNPAEFPVPKIFGYIPGNLASKNYTPSATLNAYRYFSDGLGAADNLWGYMTSGNPNAGYFPAGTSLTRNYIIRFPIPIPGVKFGYAVTANWTGTAPQFHPSHASEAVAVHVGNNSTLYYVDETNNGGDLVLDIFVFDWDAELSGGYMQDYTMIVESTVLSSPYILTADETIPVASGDHWNRYHVEIPADNVTGIDGNEMWVIIEDASADYTNPFGVPNSADGDKITACFRYPHTISNVEINGLHLTAPNGGEQWKVSGSGEVTWTSTGSITNVQIRYSMDSGSTYPYEISNSTPNDGSFTWSQIPLQALGSTLRIKISDYDDSNTFDESDADFSVVIPAIEVTSPNGSECFTAGYDQTITWIADPSISNVTIMLSLNSGVDYGVMVIDTTPNDGEFLWENILGDYASSTCRIKVQDAIYPGQIFDESDADFEILDATNNFQIEVTTTNSPQDFICRFVNPGTLHVDWGDLSTNDYNATVNVTHTYATAGVYTISMSGYVNLIDFFIYPDPGLGTPELISAILTPIQGITGLNSALEMFKHCENIPSIPAGIFDQCPGITTFYDTFLACRHITSIPPGLFNAQTNVTSFYATFDNCDLITQIPPGLFDNHTNNLNFAWLFAKCYDLQSIPVGLFDTNTNNKTFSYTFFRCYDITSIPANLFDHNALVTDFSYCFYECTNLTSIPPLLFDHNTLVTDFSYCFYNCTNLTGPSPTNSAGLKLWELSPAPVGTGCFYNCTNLSDYASIPAEWK